MCSETGNIPEDSVEAFKTYVQETVKRYRVAKEHGECPRCGIFVPPDTVFDNELSAEEHRLSGFCQKCQNEIFAPEEDETDDYFRGLPPF